ncbi:DDE-type integrase/transposase/recombinase [Pseudomonas sp. IPO3775]|nr:DDE-type integrase/transposase/recombinase [Pseudomonas sp. IPO3775]NWA75564.1 DDE-type integrase/transposase/recombinase [Pseudomonas sp. C8002]
MNQDQTAQPLVHHSDRAGQYRLGIYQEQHAKHGIRCSMTGGYDCYQNALAERVNGILRAALLPERQQDFMQSVEPNVTQRMLNELSPSPTNGGNAVTALRLGRRTPERLLVDCDQMYKR